MADEQEREQAMEQLRPDSPDGNGDEEELEDEEDGDEMPEAQPHGGGMPVDDILNDPIVMAHIMRLMRAQAATARNAKKQERKVAPAVVVAALRSRRSELRSLAAASLSPLLARLGHNVWTMIAGHLEARDLVRLSSACWYFRALTEDDSFWERIFARQVGGVSLVTRCCTSFRERFFLCQPMADLETALATGEDGDEILLCPGVYEMRGERDPFIDSAFTVENSVHIRGCMFNQKFAADLNWNHPQDMNHLGTGNVIIRSCYTNALDWRALGGSLTNVEVQYVNSDPSQYYFALKVENQVEPGHEGLKMVNVAAWSTQQMAMSVHGGIVTAVGCRFYGSEGCGLSLVDGATAVLERCVLERNSCGISVNNSSLVISDSIISANRFSGCGVVGADAKVKMERCNVFHHPLQGVELLNDVPLSSVVFRGNDIHDNLNGLLRWCAPDADTEAVQKQLAAENNAHDNRKADIKCKVLPVGKNLADMADEANVCTFVFTGPNFVEQPIFHCNTCGLNGRAGVCQVCARTCHQGHDIEFYARNSFYCDCAADPRCGHRQVLQEKVMEKEQYGSKVTSKVTAK